jgi:protoheme IX farnesyltransferase
MEKLGARGSGQVLKAYVQLTKPRIVTLLLITTVPAMVVAADGMPSIWLILATLLGGTLSAGGANAINQYYDRDIDRLMNRTSSRPLPTHRVEPHKALAFGVALGVLAFVWLTLTVNVLSAALSLAALLFYVFVYTVWMKRSTPQNIVIGGAAGAVPCLVGWAAVTNRLSLAAWILFAIVFCWTPPHFWALAMKYKDDYAAAGVPMLPVVSSVNETTRGILLYSLLTVCETILLLPVARLGPLYLLTALILGGGFLYLAVRLRRHPDVPRALGLFKYSITYLALLFLAMAADRLVIG